jgi:hypothetical protein
MDAVAAHAAHLNTIQTFLSEAEQAYRDLTHSVDASFKHHKRYWDSVTRKFHYRITRVLPQFEDRASKESAAYFVALRDQSQAED